MLLARRLLAPLSRGAARAMAAAGGSAGALRFKVYTKTGDAGESSLYTGERRAKDDDFFAALGDVDELNAAIGLAREHCAAGGVALEAQLIEIQSRLLDVGSAIATPAGTSTPEQRARAAFPSAITRSLEGWIDEFDAQLPPLKNFILPVRRAACRRRHCGSVRVARVRALTRATNSRPPSYVTTVGRARGLAAACVADHLPARGAAHGRARARWAA